MSYSILIHVKNAAVSDPFCIMLITEQYLYIPAKVRFCNVANVVIGVPKFCFHFQTVLLFYISYIYV